MVSFAESFATAHWRTISFSFVLPFLRHLTLSLSELPWGVSFLCVPFLLSGYPLHPPTCADGQKFGTLIEGRFSLANTKSFGPWDCSLTIDHSPGYAPTFDCPPHLITNSFFAYICFFCLPVDLAGTELYVLSSRNLFEIFYFFSFL